MWGPVNPLQVAPCALSAILPSPKTESRRRQWHSTPVLLPGNSHGWRSLVGCAVHEVAKSQTQLRDFTFTFHFHALEKEMATHSRVLAWRIPGTGEPGGLPSMGSHRVRHDWSDLAAAAAAILSLEQSSSPVQWFSSSAAYQNHLESFFFFFCLTTWHVEPGPGFEPVPPALGAQNLNHWTFTEVLHLGSFKKYWWLGLDHRDSGEINSPWAQTEYWDFSKLSRWF